MPVGKADFFYYIRSLIEDARNLADNNAQYQPVVRMSLILKDKPASPSLETVSKKPRKLTFPERVWGMLACFRSVHLAIVLISLLAIATMVGVMMPQEGLVDLMQIKKQFGANYRIYRAMGLFDVYNSYWFICLEVLFFLNLLCGSFQWLKPAFLAATRKTFCGPEHILTSPHKLEFPASRAKGENLRAVSDALKKRHYTVHASCNEKTGVSMLYAAKGNFSRLGPAVAHTGILLLLLASVYGVFFGFKAQKLAVPGETFAIPDSQMFRTNVDDSIWLGSVPEWKIKVNDFRIQYYGPGETADKDSQGNPNPVKQYYADLSIVKPDGKILKRETISVNHPMSQDAVNIYQASFNPTGKLFVEVNGQKKKISTNTQFMNRPVSFNELPDGKVMMVFPFFVQQDPGVTRNYAVFFLRDDHGFVGAKPGKMPPNLKLLEGQEGTLSGYHFKYVKPEIATGLQIKQGPEVPWMYAAYITVILGTIMCVFSQRRIWVAVTDEGKGQSRALLQYKTNKARLSFMKELQGLQKELNARLEKAP